MSRNRTYILGLSAFSYDSSAALLARGEIIAACQEERFSRVKHAPSFPVRSIQYCLKEAGIDRADIDVVAYSEKPVRADSIKVTKEHIYPMFGEDAEIFFSEYNRSHAAGAFFPSPYNEAAIITIGGSGEGSSTLFANGEGNSIEVIKEVPYPHSISLLYSAFTRYCGFKIASGEYKLMGLAPYGEPLYKDLIFDKLVTLREDGTVELDLEYFAPEDMSSLINKKFRDLFGGPPRQPEGPIEKLHLDLASSVQAVTEDVMLKMAGYVHGLTGSENLCLSGGIALNCVSNGRMLKKGPFSNVWVQPASTDAGCSLGAAFLAWHEHLGKERISDGRNDKQKASLLGPSFSNEEIKTYLDLNNIPYERHSHKELCGKVSKLISEGKVIGWFQGRMEFGPRALGSRSILADPRRSDMQEIINRKVKFRESFRPFAPSVLLDKARDYFELDTESPYMLFVAKVKEDIRAKEEETYEGLDKLKMKRSALPAVTHVDHSARVQTVKREDNPLFYDLLKRFHDDTGCAALVNTSFNVRGEPIVCTPEDAYNCFRQTDIDHLAIGEFLIPTYPHPGGVGRSQLHC